MTREEAINIISQMIKDEEGFLSDNTVEAHKMAIQALSQEPCEDAVSREAALEKMADYVASGYADSAEDFEKYSRIICQLPSVTSTQKYGKWIDGKCNKCGTHAPFWAMATTYYCSKYCPNCGRRMIDPQESEDKE